MKSKFTVRVELLNIEYDNSAYSILHQAMEDAGFTKTIKGSDGAVYNLPPAEYNYVGTKTAEEILDLAGSATLKTKHKSAILVTESSGRKWRGLEKADDYSSLQQMLSELID